MGGGGWSFSIQKMMLQFFQCIFGDYDSPNVGFFQKNIFSGGRKLPFVSCMYVDYWKWQCMCWSKFVRPVSLYVRICINFRKLPFVSCMYVDYWKWQCMHWLLDSGLSPHDHHERERKRSFERGGSLLIVRVHLKSKLIVIIFGCHEEYAIIRATHFFFSEELEFLKMKKRCGSLADIFEPPRKGFLCSNGIFWNLLCLYNFFYSFCPHPPLFRIQSTKKVFWLIAFNTILLQCTVWWPCYWFFGLCRCGRQESIVGGNSQEDTGQHTQWDQLIAQFFWI